MHSSLHHEIAKARLPDLHAQAQRDALARAARRARRAQRHQPSHPARTLSGIPRLVLAILGVRGT